MEWAIRTTLTDTVSRASLEVENGQLSLALSRTWKNALGQDVMVPPQHEVNLVRTVTNTLAELGPFSSTSHNLYHRSPSGGSHTGVRPAAA